MPVLASFSHEGRFGAEPTDVGRLVASFLTFTLLLACYYVVRPVRDALAATLGADSIKYLSSTVFFVMLAIVPIFGWLVRHVPRGRLVPALYAFFVVNLALFALAFGRFGETGAAGALCARLFYVWVTVFNMFAVSVFWSRMADVWSEPQARRYFGMVSAGGSLGGVLGPLLARSIAANVAIGGLIWVSAGLLIGAMIGLNLLAAAPAARAVGAPARAPEQGAGLGQNAAPEQGAGLGQNAAHEPTATPERTAAPEQTIAPGCGGVLESLWLIGRTPFLAGIALLVCLGSFFGMIVYIEMARLVGAVFSNAAQRAAFYSTRDLWVNCGAFVLQLFIVGQVTRRLGVGTALIASGCIVLAAFLWLGLDPTLATLTAVSVILRCCEFGLAKPARDMLYTVLPVAAKYQSKNVIDTTVYRASDMASGWLQALIGRLGVTLGYWGWIAAALTAVFTALAALVGRGYRRRGGR